MSRFIAWTSALAVWLALASAAQAQIYSPPTETVKGHAPVINSVAITGSPSGAGGAYIPGDVLTVSYVQSDPDMDPADPTATNATIQWYSGTTAVGTLGSSTYTIAASDLGKVISVKLTPKTDALTTDPYEGVVADSSTISPTEGEGYVGIGQGDTAVSVAITGTAEVGETLTAVTSCAVSCAAGITYQWEIETSVGSGTYQDIAGATGTTYLVLRTDQKRKIRVEATNP